MTKDNDFWDKDNNYPQSDVDRLKNNLLKDSLSPLQAISIIKELYKLGLTELAIAHLLARRRMPDGFMLALQLLFHESKNNENTFISSIAWQACKLTYWRLYPNRRFVLEKSLLPALNHPHGHKDYETFLHNLRHDQREQRHENEYKSAGNLRWELGRLDFESLMSLQIDETITYEEIGILRFGYLAEYGVDHEYQPLFPPHYRRPIIDISLEEWKNIIQKEKLYDNLREEAAKLRKDLDEIINQEGLKHKELNSNTIHNETLLHRINEIKERLLSIEGNTNEKGLLFRIREYLEEESRRIFPMLCQRRVHLRLVEIEGVLGEYSFVNKIITFYPMMIKLVASDEKMSSRLKRSNEDLYNDLYTLVEMHETAHAALHLGKDSEGRMWEHPETGTTELHETLSQIYVIHLIRHLQCLRYEDTFLYLNDKQPEHYQYWRYLEHTPLETLRSFMIDNRNNKSRRNILDLAARIAQIICPSIPLFNAIHPRDEMNCFHEGVKNILNELAHADKRKVLVECADHLCQHIQAFPRIQSIISQALSFEWPHNAERQLLIVQSLIKGHPLKGLSLNLTFEQTREAEQAMLMQAEMIHKNKMIEGLKYSKEFTDIVSKKKNKVHRKGGLQL